MPLANAQRRELQGVVKKLNGGSKEILQEVVKNFNEGSKKTLPNNILYNIVDNIVDNILSREQRRELQGVVQKLHGGSAKIA